MDRTGPVCGTTANVGADLEPDGGVLAVHLVGAVRSAGVARSFDVVVEKPNVGGPRPDVLGRGHCGQCDRDPTHHVSGCVSDYRGRGPCFLAVESDQSGPYRVGIGARPDRDLRRPVRIHEFFIRHRPTVSNKCTG